MLYSECADFFAECRLVWVELYNTHLSDPWHELETQRKVAESFRSTGEVEMYRPLVHDRALVDNSCWRNLEVSLRKCYMLAVGTR